ncbi:hypothetical protein THAOC_24408, partial [Thalassiosira oceanica]
MSCHPVPHPQIDPLSEGREKRGFDSSLGDSQTDDKSIDARADVHRLRTSYRTEQVKAIVRSSTIAWSRGRRKNGQWIGCVDSVLGRVLDVRPWPSRCQLDQSNYKRSLRGAVSSDENDQNLGGGKLSRSKYDSKCGQVVTAALNNLGFVEDRGASCVNECAGCFKSQHDTGKNIFTVVVFPRIEVLVSTASSGGSHDEDD